MQVPLNMQRTRSFSAIRSVGERLVYPIVSIVASKELQQSGAPLETQELRKIFVSTHRHRMPMPQPYAPGTAASHDRNSQDALANPLREMTSLLITTGGGKRDWAAMEGLLVPLTYVEALKKVRKLG